MKKLLLSSLIMFGICGFVTAQNAQNGKLGKTADKANTISPAPQKSAVAEEKVIVADEKTSADKAPSDLLADKVPVNPAAEKANKKQAEKAASAVAVDEAGVVVDAEVAKKAEMKKAEAAKAAADKKQKEN